MRRAMRRPRPGRRRASNSRVSAAAAHRATVVRALRRASVRTARANRLSGGHERGHRAGVGGRVDVAQHGQQAHPQSALAQRGQGAPPVSAVDWARARSTVAWAGSRRPERPPAAVVGRPEHRVGSVAAGTARRRAVAGAAAGCPCRSARRGRARRAGVGERVGEAVAEADRPRCGEPAASPAGPGSRRRRPAPGCAAGRRGDGVEGVGQRRRGDRGRLLPACTVGTEPGLDPARAPAPSPARAGQLARAHRASTALMSRIGAGGAADRAGHLRPGAGRPGR